MRLHALPVLDVILVFFHSLYTGQTVELALLGAARLH